MKSNNIKTNKTNKEYNKFKYQDKLPGLISVDDMKMPKNLDFNFKIFCLWILIIIALLSILNYS